ncbi:peptidylprolyl isomerase [Acinetobacter shaoyimingii]|uniref:Peptidyl-prolyl cis-trans isomerase n=1 Tax=Acinetobacter shaoyimingii TaxID=2715164 RepID=A0A6G8RZI1_9GAMM|nr:peptidylprolyl isomerase [Acinetobacter shaoyimingii]NHB59415.1 peptidylprolyl isomerase A [Acinetobacter shaoyimingii]QIO07362.1 peptidylprolyl isomerase A [Acinetobacter shaoyimingii]
MLNKVAFGLVIAIASTNILANTNMQILTSNGKIDIELFDEQAPVSVKNFKNYVKTNFYNGTIFHRVIPGFMIQGGGMDENLVEKKTNPPIRNEASNGLKNDRGTLAMARTSDPHSASSQFFINLTNNDFLNKSAGNDGYAVFGKVTNGMNIVDQIAKVSTGSYGGHQNVPKKPIKILSVTIKPTKTK